MYPTVPVQYCGNKKRWLDEIVTSLEGCDKVLDLFSGSGNVSYRLKREGKQVWSMDLMAFPCVVALACVENSVVTCSPEELPVLSGLDLGQSDLMTRLYGDKVFLKKDTDFLDALRPQIRGLRDRHKKALCLAAACAAMIAKSSWGRFNVGLNNHLTENKLPKHLKRSLEDHFVERLEKFNALVTDGSSCKVLMANATGKLARTLASKVDAVYLDPPYPTYRRKTAYEYFYHVVETYVRYDEDFEVQEQGNVQKFRASEFSGSPSSVADVLKRMFKQCESAPLWVVSYSDHSRPGIDELMGMLGDREISVIERQGRFAKSAYSKNEYPSEYLISARRA